MNEIHASNQINQVVDNVADKLGLAVEKVAPIAETMVQEVITRGMVMAALYGIATIIGVLIIVILIFTRMKRIKSVGKGWENSESEITYFVVGIFISVVAFIFSMICLHSVFVYLHQALSPTWYIFNTIMN